MPIDPSIAARVQPIQIDSPMQTMAQVAALHNMQQQRDETAQRIQIQRDQLAIQQQAAAEKLKKDQQTKAAQAALGPALIEGGDSDTIMKTIRGIPDPETQFMAFNAYQGFKDKQSEIDLRESTKGKNDLEAQRMRVQQLGDLARDVRDIGQYSPQAIDFAFRVAISRDKTGEAERYYQQYQAHPEMGKALIDGLITQAEESVKLGVNEKLVSPVTGATIAEGNKPVVNKPNQQKDEFWLTTNGKREFVKGSYDPDSGKYFHQGQDVTDRAKPEVPRPPPDPNQVRPMTANQKLVASREIRAEWSREIKPYVERKLQQAKIVSGLAELDAGNKGPATEILIITFEKMLDEISVVREAEYGRPGEMQSMQDRITGSLRQLKQGGTSLTDENLRALAKAATEVANGLNSVSAEFIQDRRDAIRASIKDTDVTEEMIFGPSKLGIRKAAAGAGSTVTVPAGEKPATHRFNPATGQIEAVKQP